MMGHAAFFAEHFSRAAEEEVDQEDRRDHDALSFRCVVGWALAVVLASNALSMVVRFRAMERPIRKARRSQKAAPKTNNAKTAPVSAWPITGEIAS
jgi:hypothetical protein